MTFSKAFVRLFLFGYLLVALAGVWVAIYGYRRMESARELTWLLAICFGTSPVCLFAATLYSKDTKGAILHFALLQSLLFFSLLFGYYQPFIT